MFDLCQCITLNSKKVSSRQDQARIQIQAGPTFFMDPWSSHCNPVQKAYVKARKRWQTSCQTRSWMILSLSITGKNSTVDKSPFLPSFGPTFQTCKNTKTPWFLKGFCNQLPAGLEPATYALRMRCSTNWATEAPLKNAAAYATASDLSGNRTRVYAVRGRRLDRLTNRPWFV